MTSLLEKVTEIAKHEDLKKYMDAIEKITVDDISVNEIAAAFMLMSLGIEEIENIEEEEYLIDDTGAEEGMVRLFMNIGKNQRIKPGDILGAIAGETGMPGKLIGIIDMYDKYSFVEVPREYAKEVVKVMKDAKIKGKSINIEPAGKKIEGKRDRK
jgi:ATP-dependent RNA helicase DeaD